MGGTKMVCAVADETNRIIERLVIPTTNPQDTLIKVRSFFNDKKIESLGIGSFGPIDLNKKSKTYGFITSTPKNGWKNTDIVGFFKYLNIPISFDTDVNAACIGEVYHGTGFGLDSVIYGTIGTGIGFGVYIDGKLIHGLMHTEVGHMLLQKHEIDKYYSGPCPYHNNCLETLASGPSIEKRWGKKAEELYGNDNVWELESYYLSQALANCVMCYSPKKIILGGGVMHNKELLRLIKEKTLLYLNGYIKKEEIINDIDNYIVLPKLGDDAGIVGCIELGRLLLNELSR